MVRRIGPCGVIFRGTVCRRRGEGDMIWFYEGIFVFMKVLQFIFHTYILYCTYPCRLTYDKCLKGRRTTVVYVHALFVVCELRNYCTVSIYPSSSSFLIAADGGVVTGDEVEVEVEVALSLFFI